MLRSLLNPEYDSVSTDELSNDEEPNIDLSEPSWMAYTDTIWYSVAQPESLDGWKTASSGSGGTDHTGDQVRMSTGTTSGSTAEVAKSISSSRGLVAPTWDKTRILRTAFRPIETGNRTDYVTTGDVQGGKAGFGIKLTGGNLVGVVHDGTTETTTAALAPHDSEANFEFVAKLNPGTSVEFWMDKDPLTNPPDETVTSDLPSGAAPGLNHFFFHRHVENSAAANKRQDGSAIRVIQLP